MARNVAAVWDGQIPAVMDNASNLKDDNTPTDQLARANSGTLVPTIQLPNGLTIVQSALTQTRPMSITPCQLGRRPNSGSMHFGNEIMNRLRPNPIPLTAEEKAVQRARTLAVVLQNEVLQLEMLATVVPAVVFPKFSKLPLEVQLMIWGIALPTFVEVITDPDRYQ